MSYEIFIPTIELVHPETREVLLEAGKLYPWEEAGAIAQGVGADAVAGAKVTCEDWRWHKVATVLSV